MPKMSSYDYQNRNKPDPVWQSVLKATPKPSDVQSQQPPDTPRSRANRFVPSHVPSIFASSRRQNDERYVHSHMRGSVLEERKEPRMMQHRFMFDSDDDDDDEPAPPRYVHSYLEALDALLAQPFDPFRDALRSLANFEEEEKRGKEHITFVPMKYCGSTGQEEKCVICLELFTEGKEIVTLPCKHEFCIECIKQWSKENAICPMCRSVIL